MRFLLKLKTATVLQDLKMDLFKVDQQMEQIAKVFMHLHNARHVSKDYMDLLAVQIMQMIALIVLVVDMVIK